MVTRACMLLCVALAACSEDVVVVVPVIDGPPLGSDAAAFPDLDSIVISIAIAGEETDLASVEIPRGEPIELPDVPYGENLVIHMVGKTGGDLVAYGRTCKFAIRPGETPPAPHLYFSRILQWGLVDTYTGGVRNAGIALTHRDGSALFLGGFDANNAAVPASDRFDAVSGEFATLVGVAGRRGGSAARLGDGRVLIAGGVDPATDAPMSAIELLQVEQQRVDTIPAGALETLATPALAELTDGDIVAAGGRDATNTPRSQLVLVDLSDGEVKIRQPNDAKLVTARYGATATRVSDDLGAAVLIAGGFDAANLPVLAAELYKPPSESMSTSFTAPMNVGRRDHKAGRLPDGSILIIGGRDMAGAPVSTVEVFRFDAGFSVLRDLAPPFMMSEGEGVNDFTITALPDNRLLIAGGHNSANAAVRSASIAEIDEDDAEIVPTSTLNIARANHQATVLCDGTVLLVGGTTEPAPAERYNPAPTGRR